MRIRAYTVADAAALARIFHDAVQIGTAADYTQAQRDDWSAKCPTAEAWENRLIGLTTFVAEDAGVPVGYMSMRDEDGYLDLAFVSPSMIGQGVAYGLYLAVLDHARALGLSQMTVEASAASYRFFKRQGWHETGRKTRGEGAAMIETRLMAGDIIGSVSVVND